MRSPRRGFGRFGLPAALATLVVVALLVSVPTPTRAQTSPTATPAQSGAGVSYTVTWNNVDVSSASTASSAMTIGLSQSANLVYYWNVSVGSRSNVTINDARLQMYYLGFAVSTRDQILSSPTPGSGHIPLSWTPISVSYLIEGLYRLTASFVAPNGTTMWSENFWVRGTALYGFLAILPIVLLIIIIYEVYGLARSGRYAAIGRKVEAPPPPSPPPPSTTAPAAPAEGPEEPSPPSDTSGESPPPSGGSS